DRIRAEDVRSLRSRIIIQVIAADPEVIIVDSAGKRPIAIVLPGARAALVVRYDDEIEIVGNHVDHILRTEIPDAFQVSPSRVRMEITDEREMRKVRKKLLHAPRCASILFDARVTAIRRLIRDRVLDNIDVAAVAITKEQTEALFLVHFDRRYQ